MFMNRPSMFDYYTELTDRIRKEVASKEDSYLLTVDPEEYATYLLERHALPEIVFDESRDRFIEKVRRQQQVQDPIWGLATREVVWARIGLPVIPDDRISDVLNLIPSTFTMSPPKMEYDKGFIVTEALAKESDVQTTIQKVEQEISWRNQDIQKHNEELSRTIKQSIEKRKQQIQDEENLFDQIVEKVSVPLKRRDEVGSLVPSSLKVKQKIRPIMPPKTERPIELQLPRDKLDAILDLSHQSCLQFERTPQTYAKLTEEDLRNIILSNLNAVFEGDAVGEAFSKLGKTDIYLKVSEGGIFIAECKYWRGPQTVGDATAQILGYLTWRHSYGVVILFSKNKGFSNVLQAVAQALPSLASYAEGYKQVADTHFVALHRLPEDGKKLVELHYLVYDLYSEKGI